MLLAAAAFVALASCDSPSERAEGEIEELIESGLPPGASVEVDADDQSVRVESAGGELARGDDLPIPDWLPAELSLPPDARITTIFVVDEFHVLRAQTEATSDELRRRYENAFDEAGWPIEQQWTVEGPVALKARDADGVPVSIEVGDGELAIILGRE